MTEKPKGPRDVNQLAKFIVDVATGVTSNDFDTSVENKNQAAVELGRPGGLKGGKARAEALSTSRRSEIAQAAALARWKRSAPAK